MFAREIAGIVVSLAVIGTPLAAQSTLGAYGPFNAKYRIINTSKTSQIMMGQSQESESSANQLVSVAVTKAGDGLGLVMTLDSATMTSTAQAPMPNLAEALGLKLTGTMAPDGKVSGSAVTDKAGAPSTSQIAGNMRSFLPRLKVGAAPGATWTDSSSNTTTQDDAEIKTATVVTYTLAGDTTLAGVKASKIVGVSVTKMMGRGNRMGADYTITGDVKGTVTSIVGAGGVLLAQNSDADSNLSVNVEAAGMVIPIVTKTVTKIEKQP